MTYDFSTPQKIAEFEKSLKDTNHWHEPLPNLRWLTESEFAQSHFFMYSGGRKFTRAFGGPNARDNLTQLPPGWREPRHTAYARCFLMSDLKGFVILSEYHHVQEDAPNKYVVGGVVKEWRGKLYFGQFTFCDHKNRKQQNLGRCWNAYTCNDCGFRWEVDSSD